MLPASHRIADAATLRRLDPAGDLINQQARGSGLADTEGVPALVRRDDQDQWRIDAITRARLRDLWHLPGR
jgi:hypothetical protein